ncbi:MAG: hypothetical protein COV01_02715 [Candidatus Taylorbacteria bacterium CG10_big_fil_rev_8_21_14_0_10_41_48]|uniref:Uncharacterized protein n=1 Tax=Candidatus Taylorbacteria bacterium CG10_big_fil_rev_8_21_14_0_10_41_48 TaxID=1975024 RepID=A0A2M8LBK7_9BACT|nr:MAG: hypothetical protein COV01_02715 [Candidatus Taylorbacteria bacterium CG10_big_fil_rev_8_21_14_0_10_41_48]
MNKPPPANKKVPAKKSTKKTPTLLSTIFGLRVRIRHLILTFVWSLAVITATAILVIFIARRGNGSEEQTRVLSAKLDEVKNTIRTENKNNRDVINNAVIELKETTMDTTAAVVKSSGDTIDTFRKITEGVAAKLETEGIKSRQSIEELKSVNQNGFTEIKAKIETNSINANTSIDALNASVKALEDELASVKISQTATVVESPKTHIVNIGDVGLSMAHNAPRVQPRDAERFPGVTSEKWEHVPAGVIYYCSPEAIRHRCVEVDDVSGIIAMSFRGWFSRKLIGQYPVGDTVPIVVGATSIGLMHPTRDFNVKVKR